ncbi:MAG: acetyl-CoA carboxylase biotin carboxylase subunit, partial [Campylobacter sp.]|nr:acetyl-CoA carboxylase biotin carboxylase subunit [Campylobacter sp.]
MYMEKYITNPRHIEVQVLGDEHGHVVHIGERDCSMQRRHQKLIEESPAVILDEPTRKSLHETAVRAAKAIGYASAGTFEFLYDSKDKKFYFIEMNTRLQVEHTVSEMRSGLDLIEWMIRIAQGEKLLPQSEIKFSGHALECRITAEDSKSFMPNPGKITKYVAPGGRNVRMDSHVYEGYSVPPYYDSMIGKLIVHDKDRARAIAKMKVALDELIIGGIKSTRDFHLRMMNNPDFVDNNYDTNYLAKH